MEAIISVASVEGKESVAIAISYESKAKGALGCWLVLSEWEKTNDDYHTKDVQCVKVDGEKIKADTWYILKGGNFTDAIKEVSKSSIGLIPSIFMQLVVVEFAEQPPSLLQKMPTKKPHFAAHFRH